MSYDVCENGVCRNYTPEELAQMEHSAKVAEAEYWANIPYDDAVDAEIRKKYTASQEFAILRQKDIKPDEYSAYYVYCEECKTHVKSKKGLYAIN